MIVDGKSIAKDILESLKRSIEARRMSPRLAVVTCAPNFETRKFLALKKRKADEVGIALTVREYPESATTEDLIDGIARAAAEADGIVVQLPLPRHIDRTRVIAAVPRSHDVDALSYDGGDALLPPVVGAIAAISAAHGIEFAGANVTVVGEGMLVGKPAAVWARAQGANVTVVHEGSEDAAQHMRAADILILGAGKPHFITPDDVKEGIIIFDAGTSESAGALVGDADPACAKKASFFTPVPGGIGPVTVAVLLRNAAALAR